MRLRPAGPNDLTLDVDDVQEARVEVRLIALDGAPCISLEIEDGGMILSAREAEEFAKALVMAAVRIRPHERLMLRRRKWEMAR